MLCFCFLGLGIGPSVFTLGPELRVVTREEHTVLGKNRIASGREQAFKACAVSFGSSQEGSVLLAVFLRSRPCSDSLSALPTSV